MGTHMTLMSNIAIKYVVSSHARVCFVLAQTFFVAIARCARCRWGQVGWCEGGETQEGERFDLAVQSRAQRYRADRDRDRDIDRERERVTLVLLCRRPRCERRASSCDTQNQDSCALSELARKLSQAHTLARVLSRDSQQRVTGLSSRDRDLYALSESRILQVRFVGSGSPRIDHFVPSSTAVKWSGAAVLHASRPSTHDRSALSQKTQAGTDTLLPEKNSKLLELQLRWVKPQNVPETTPGSSGRSRSGEENRRSTNAQPGLPQQVQQPARLEESKTADAQHASAVERFSNPRAETSRTMTSPVPVPIGLEPSKKWELE